ncbi:hypothetical protein AB4305_27225 [Nocardia sp. 2YAB30]|uniref:hypothetical protein n=1 Tax=Nocardia sp. 2YAB30 TaxID=3233022 RepID=UPI003F9704CE
MGGVGVGGDALPAGADQTGNLVIDLVEVVADEAGQSGEFGRDLFEMCQVDGESMPTAV